MIYAYLFVGLVIVERFVELKIASRNETWMKERGAVEKGKGHYKLFVALHIAFFVSLFIELQGIEVTFHPVFFTFFMLAQLVRIWCITALGKFWNTKIIVLPNVAIIKKGPYKYMKHPNYVIVFIELFVLPAMFGAFMTASLFPLLHMLLLAVRIPIEEKALGRN